MGKQQGILTQVDLDKIHNLIDASLDVKLDLKLANYATKENLTKLRQDMLGDKAEILAAINNRESEGLAHDSQHKNLATDTTRLKQQVHHLFNNFKLADPTEVAPAY